MAKAEATILNYLNEDCWKAVLDKVPVKDIIRTEATSHGWQKVILTYLRRIRIGIGLYDLSHYIRNNEIFLDFKDNTAEFSSFKSCINKLGSSVVSSYSTKDYSLEIIGENCPNLEFLMLVKQENQTLLKVQYENLRWLKRLYFEECDSVCDAAISRFVCNNTVLEELKLFSNGTVTGKFLADITSTLLKSLGFYSCKDLEANHLLSSVPHSLTTFELAYVPKDIFKSIHLILQKLPKLEHLVILDLYHYYGDKCDLQRDLFASVCRLSRLKNMAVSLGVTDKYLEDVSRCCKELTTLGFGASTTLTSRGVTALLRNAGARLTSLSLPSNDNVHLTDDDAVARIKGCPNLTVVIASRNFQPSDTEDDGNGFVPTTEQTEEEWHMDFMPTGYLPDSVYRELAWYGILQIQPLHHSAKFKVAAQLIWQHTLGRPHVIMENPPQSTQGAGKVSRQILAEEAAKWSREQRAAQEVLMENIKSGGNGLTVRTVVSAFHRTVYIIQNGNYYLCPDGSEPDQDAYRVQANMHDRKCTFNKEAVKIDIDPCIEAEVAPIEYSFGEGWMFCLGNAERENNYFKNGTLDCGNKTKISMDNFLRLCAIDNNVVISFDYYGDEPRKDLVRNATFCSTWDPCKISYLYRLEEPPDELTPHFPTTTENPCDTTPCDFCVEGYTEDKGLEVPIDDLGNQPNETK